RHYGKRRQLLWAMERMSITDFFNDPMRAYGRMMFLARAKEESIDANVVFDAHAADFGLVLSDYFQSALDQNHPRLRHFPRSPAYFLNEQDPVFLALKDRMRELLSQEATRRSVRGRED